MDVICGVYAIFDSSTNECLYVGQSSNILITLQEALVFAKVKKA